MIERDPYTSLGEQVDASIKELSTQATLRGSRLLRLREWMREVDWIRFCDDNPDAHDWFDERGEPL